MTVTATAYAKFYVGTIAGATATAAATTDAAELTAFEADTYVEVNETADLGEFGDEAEEIKFSSISDARVRKLKGIRDAGNLELTVHRTGSDAGQAALRTAKGDDHQRTFKVVLNDAPPAGTPTTFYFRGLVMGGRTKMGEANNVVDEVFTIAINSAIVEVPAEAA
jgi:hypothetical protein